MKSIMSICAISFLCVMVACKNCDENDGGIKSDSASVGLYTVLRNETLFDSDVYFNECHASTVARLPDGRLVVAFFAGTHEGNDDVAIWLTKENVDGSFTPPHVIANGKGLPCWNPVLFLESETRLLLFYKAGKDTETWQTFVQESDDGGESWSVAQELVAGDVGGRGPVKNKCIRLSNGSVLAPGSTESGKWECFIDISYDNCATWQKKVIPANYDLFAQKGIIQPSLWQDSDGIIHAFMRSGEGCLYYSESNDGGLSWKEAIATEIPNNNSGIDLAKLADGRIVLVYNPVGVNWGIRTPLSFAISRDNGRTFDNPIPLAAVYGKTNSSECEFSYPAVIADGRDVFITYTYKRKSIGLYHIRFGEK